MQSEAQSDRLNGIRNPYRILSSPSIWLTEYT